MLYVNKQNISNNSLVFSSCTDEPKQIREDSILNINYEISGNRNIGAHSPVPLHPRGTENATEQLTFRCAIGLQRPVLDPCLAVGFLSLPSSGLRVGQLVTMKWRVERLKYYEDSAETENKVS